MPAVRVVFQQASDPIGAILRAKDVFESAFGHAYHSAKQIFSYTRMAHPKDFNLAITDAKEAYLSNGGAPEVDLAPFLSRWRLCLRHIKS